MHNWVPGQSYKSNSDINTVFQELQSSFNTFPLYTRRAIQDSLRAKGLYNSEIDGKWGRPTLIGLAKFSIRHLRTVDLTFNQAVGVVLTAVIEQRERKYVLIASPRILTEILVLSNEQSSQFDALLALSNDFIQQPQLKRFQMQYALKKLGFYDSGIDGIWGPGTKMAFGSFAKLNNVNLGDPSKVFHALLRKVDVPSSFKTVRGTKRTSVEKSGLVAIIQNPSVSADQAVAICTPRAKLAGNRAYNSVAETDYGSSARCRKTYSNNYYCSVRKNSGGFTGGFADELSKGVAGRRAKKAEFASCLAEYGWRQ